VELRGGGKDKENDRESTMLKYICAGRGYKICIESC
jgi:hypothetical protein